MTAPWWAWLAFSGAVLILLALDLLVFHREAREPSVRDAALFQRLLCRDRSRLHRRALVVAGRCDSIPAIFAVTRAATIPRFAYLQLGLSLLLVLAGAKLVASGWYTVPPYLSVGVIAVVTGTAVGASLGRERRGRPLPGPV